MSGSSVSSSCSARMPSTLTTVSKPRTARLDRIRSTMLGSSSTTRAQVLRTSSFIAVIVLEPSVAGWLRSGAACGASGLVPRPRPAGGHAEAGALGQRGQARACRRAPARCPWRWTGRARRPVLARGRRARLERRGGQLRRQAQAVVQHADRPPRPARPRRSPGPGCPAGCGRTRCSAGSRRPAPSGRGRPTPRAGSVSQLSMTSLACSGGRQAIAASITSRMSHQSRCRRMMPDSMAEKSSRSSTSRPRRADSAAIRSRKRCWESRSQVTSGCMRLDA